MDQPMTKEESYAERRQLFKNIWETAMRIKDKDTDIMDKPKVIKTLRLDEVDRCIIGKKKKQRLKNLRTVCNKILDFCDRQDADDLFYEQLAAEGHDLPHPKDKAESNPKKTKINKTRKKVRKAKSLFTPARSPPQPKATTSERKERVIPKTKPDSTRSYNRAVVIQRSTLLSDKRTSKVKPSIKNMKPTKIHNTIPGDPSVTRRKVVKKRRSKRKKPSANQIQPPGPSVKYFKSHSPIVARSPNPITATRPFQPTKQLYRVHKISI